MKEHLFRIFLANGAVLIIPGLNFAVLTRYAIQHGLSAAILCSAGITLAISIHVILSMIGSYKLIMDTPTLFHAIKIGGAIYISFLATKIILRVIKKVDTKFEVSGSLAKGSFFHGMMIDLLNPFVTVFYITLFSSVMSEATTGIEMGVYGIFIFILTFFWFSLVSIFFSYNIIREKFLRYKNFVEIFSAAALYYYSYKLFIAQ